MKKVPPLRPLCSDVNNLNFTKSVFQRQLLTKKKKTNKFTRCASADDSLRTPSKQQQRTEKKKKTKLARKIYRVPFQWARRTRRPINSGKSKRPAPYRHHLSRKTTFHRVAHAPPTLNTRPWSRTLLRSDWSALSLSVYENFLLRASAACNIELKFRMELTPRGIYATLGAEQ